MKQEERKFPAWSAACLWLHETRGMRDATGANTIRERSNRRHWLVGRLEPRITNVAFRSGPGLSVTSVLLRGFNFFNRREVLSINGWMHGCNFYMILLHNSYENNIKLISENNIKFIKTQGQGIKRKKETCHLNQTRYTLLPRHTAALIVVLGETTSISSNNHPIPCTLSLIFSFCYDLEDV